MKGSNDLPSTPGQWDPPRKLDRNSPIPLYYQLQELLKQEIEDDRWTPGEMLPSEAELSALFGISRPVIRSALDILENDGQVYRIRGKGTIVAEPKFRYDVVAAASKWNKNKPSEVRLNQAVSARWVRAGGHIGRLLELAPSDRVLELTFTHDVQRTPASLTQLVVRLDAMPELAPGQVASLEPGGPAALTQLQESGGLVVVESRLSIEATRANAFEAELLEIEVGVPVFLVSSLEIGDHGRPVAFSRTVVRSDHFQFSAVIPASSQDGYHSAIGVEGNLEVMPTLNSSV